MNYYDGKTVLITGGASGIGLAAAQLLRRDGANLILVGRSENKLAEAEQRLKRLGTRGSIRTISVDISNPQDVQEKLSMTAQDRLDVLINNAGTVMPGHCDQLPLSEFERHMSTNYLGTVHCTRAVLPALLARGKGHIAFMSSIAGFLGVFGYSAYSPSKFAVRGFAECLRYELAPKGIKVSICYPPDTDTPQRTFELPFLPAETRAISGGKPLRAELVAKRLLDGIAAGKYEILPDLSSVFIHSIQRWAPRLVRGVMDHTIRTAQRKLRNTSDSSIPVSPDA